MANMLYNGVELPDIESVWTQEVQKTYPFVWVSSSGGDYTLQCTTARPYFDGVYIRFPSAFTRLIANYGEGYSEGEWYNPRVISHDAGLKWDGVTVVWAGFDFLNSDGTIYLPASDPVDPNAPTGPSIDLDFWRFAAMGMFLKSVVWGKKATMYSYNGVVLPALPESELPYAVIVDFPDDTSGSKALYFTTQKCLCDAKVYGEAVYMETTGNRIRYNLSDDRTAWEYLEETTNTTTVISTMSNTEILWCNHDIVNRDTGEVHHEASDPVPVYE